MRIQLLTLFDDSAGVVIQCVGVRPSDCVCVSAYMRMYVQDCFLYILFAVSIYEMCYLILCNFQGLWLIYMFSLSNIPFTEIKRFSFGK